MQPKDLDEHHVGQARDRTGASRSSLPDLPSRKANLRRAHNNLNPKLVFLFGGSNPAEGWFQPAAARPDGCCAFAWPSVLPAGLPRG
jgi:hypothetical protein